MPTHRRGEPHGKQFVRNEEWNSVELVSIFDRQLSEILLSLYYTAFKASRGGLNDSASPA